MGPVGCFGQIENIKRQSLNINRMAEISTSDFFKKIIDQETQDLQELEKFTFGNPIGQDINSLLRDINMEIVTIHDYLQHRVFNDIDYYAIVGLSPIWTREGGHGQESAMSKAFFEKMVQENNNYLTNKLLYYHDCEMLVNSLQNRFTVIEELINQVYKVLSPVIDVKMHEFDNVCFRIDSSSIHTHACMNSIFINLASSCDIMTKVAVELGACTSLDFSNYPKMKSLNIMYGDWKKVLPDSLKISGTYYDMNQLVAISKIETLRNEIVHNGSLDFNYTVYYGIKDEQIYRWILCPSFDVSGKFTSFKNRKKFYDDGSRTFNEQLPLMVRDFLVISKRTLEVIRTEYETPYYEDKNDLKKYHSEILNWSKSFVEVAKSRI